MRKNFLLPLTIVFLWLMSADPAVARSDKSGDKDAAPTQILMSIEGIDGGSGIAGHETWFAIESLQWGAGRGISSGSYDDESPRKGKKGSKAKDEAPSRKLSSASVSEVSLSRTANKSSTTLLRAAFETKPRQITLKMIDTKTKATLYTMTLHETYISGYSVSATSGSSLSESISLNYSKFDASFTGSDKDTVTYDIMNNRIQ